MGGVSLNAWLRRHSSRRFVPMDVGAAKMGAETSRYVQTRIFLSYPQSVMSVVCVSHRPLPNRDATSTLMTISTAAAMATIPSALMCSSPKKSTCSTLRITWLSIEKSGEPSGDDVSVCRFPGPSIDNWCVKSLNGGVSELPQGVDVTQQSAAGQSCCVNGVSNEGLQIALCPQLDSGRLSARSSSALAI
jgi:hypothetical protein